MNRGYEKPVEPPAEQARRWEIDRALVLLQLALVNLLRNTPPEAITPTPETPIVHSELSGNAATAAEQPEPVDTPWVDRLSDARASTDAALLEIDARPPAEEAFAGDGVALPFNQASNSEGAIEQATAGTTEHKPRGIKKLTKGLFDLAA